METSPEEPTPKDEVELNEDMKSISVPAAAAISPEDNDDAVNGILEKQKLLRELQLHLQQQQQQQKRQLQGRIKIRQQKLKVTFFGYIVVLIFFAILQFIGVLTFTLGFLLSRNVLPDIADAQLDPQLVMSAPPAYDKMVLLVIDALRFDFVIPVEEDGSERGGKPYHNQFPVLYDMFQKYPENSILLKFLADPPTTTLQRLKGLTTGSLPTFIDAGSNFDGDAIDEDNWLLQLHKHNKSIAFMGDDTWKALFTEYINPNLFFPFDSLNVWDLHTVDNGVIDNMMPLLESNRQPEWDVLIGHFLGVDHVGHRYGPDNNAMKPKLSQMDDVIRKVIDKLDSRTLLCVMGDHGMDSTGNHGGDSKDELESTLFMYSKNKKSGFKRFDSSAYDVSDLGASYRSVNQIDFVPTISLLLGLPIPHNNLGSPIQEVFGKNFEEASIKTTNQIQKFRKVAGLDDDEVLNDLYDSVINNHSTDSSITFQTKFLEQCRGMWATFDLKLIVIGVLIILASNSFIVTYSRLIPSVRVLTMSFEFIGSVISMMLLGLVLLFSVTFVLKPAAFSFKRSAAIGSSIGIFVGLWAPIMDRFSVAWLLHQLHDFFIYNFNGWSVLGISFIIGHSLIFASNSFVVWEDKMIHYFIQTFGFYCLAQCTIKISDKRERVLAIAHSISFLIMGRLASGITLCREEQQPYCQSNFQITWLSVVGLYGIALILPRMIKSFYTLANSYHSAAPLWIGTGLTYLLYGNAIYWTLEYLHANNGNDTGFEYFVVQWLGRFKIANEDLPVNEAISRLQTIVSSISKNVVLAISVGEPLITSLKLAIARISMFITLVLANYSWSRGPLCVKLAEQPDGESQLKEDSDEDSSDNNGSETKKNPVVILGYQNVYGSSYFLLLLNFAIPIMLVNKPLGAFAIGILLVQILTLLELFHILKLRGNIISPVMFGFLAYQHFFSTGHQATLQAIQWDVGFITTETITFPFTHLSIALNTFGSFILICIAIPLITLWKIPPSSKPITVLSQIVTNITTLLTYQTIISISSLAFAGHFRRHLMVWKIFAPRFMMSGILLLLMNVIMIFITLWFGSGRLLSQVNRIFGK